MFSTASKVFQAGLFLLLIMLAKVAISLSSVWGITFPWNVMLAILFMVSWAYVAIRLPRDLKVLLKAYIIHKYGKEDEREQPEETTDAVPVSTRTNQ